MRLWEIFRFEVGYQWSRLSTRLYCGAFAALALLITAVFVTDAREDQFFFNAPVIIAASTVLTTMFGMLVMAALASDAATRDAHARMAPLVYSTPVTKGAYLGGRFLGAFAVSGLLLALVPPIFALATRIPGVEAEIVGPMRFGAYCSSYLVFALPNAFIATAVFFAITAVSRKPLASYGAAGLLFLTSVFSDTYLAGVLGRWELAKHVDPFGFTAVRAMWRSLTPLQKKSSGIDFSEALITNRLLWMGFAVAVLALAHWRFRFASRERVPARAPMPLAAAQVEKWGQAPLLYLRRFDGMARLGQVWEIARTSLREMVTTRIALGVPLAALLVVLLGPEFLEISLGTPGHASTGRVVGLFGGFGLDFVLAALITLYAGQLVWRDRDARMNSIADTVPVSDGVTFAGKFLALLLMIVSVQAVLMTAGVVMQSTQGHGNFELALYARVLFGLQLVDAVLFAVLALLVHVLVPQKHASTILTLSLFLFVRYAPELGVERKLLLYGAAPGWTYSEFFGFSSLTPWLWFKVYWSGWALAFVVLTRLFWPRGEERGLRWRIVAARRRVTRTLAAVTVVAVAVIVAAGGFVSFNTSVLHGDRTGASDERMRAEYERRYARFATLRQPTVTATKLVVDFHSPEHTAEVRGTYALQNRTNAAIEAIHLVTHVDLATGPFVFDRPATLAVADEQRGYHIYTLREPLRPGEAVRVSFTVRSEPEGFTNRGPAGGIRENGAFFEHRSDDSPSGTHWLPTVGYQRGRELWSEGDRRRFGLSPRTNIRSLHDVAARSDTAGRERIDLEVIVRTDVDQYGVAPGALLRTWTEGGRRHFHYRSDAPIRNGYAVFSANYARHAARWNDVDIEVLHHPAHAWNVERMVRSVQATLAYHTRHFGPYPHKQLRLVEFPGNGVRLTAHAGTIMYSEKFAAAHPEADDRAIDLPFAIVAHEVAHQWWGHRIVPAEVEGAAVLTESLAWYSAMRVVEQELGREHLLRILSTMRREYLAPRATRETPLLRATDRIDTYRTGPFAMFALRERVGEGRVNSALRKLLAAHPPERAPYPTSLDLYALLQAEAPEAKPLLRDLFEDITFWDVRMKDVAVQRAGKDYRVTMSIDAGKLKANPSGHETRVPMEDTIDVGIYGTDGKPLYLRKHRIRSGPQAITVTLPRAPGSAAIDPDHALLDRVPSDNWKYIY